MTQKRGKWTRKQRGKYIVGWTKATERSYSAEGRPKPGPVTVRQATPEELAAAEEAAAWTRKAAKAGAEEKRARQAEQDTRTHRAPYRRESTSNAGRRQRGA